MAIKKAIVVAESIEDLRDKLKSTRDFQVQKRIVCLILLKENRFKRRTQLADHLCIGYSTLKRWLKEYREDGLEAYLHLGSANGRPTVISPELHKVLQEKVNDPLASFHSYRDVWLWVNNDYGEAIAYQTIRQYLIRNMGTKLKVPRKSHYKKDEQAIEAFLKTT